MKKASVILITALCSLAMAQPPRQLNIYHPAIDSFNFSLFDSITVGNLTDFQIHLKTGDITTFPISQIDSLRFPFIGGPVCRVIAPNGGETWHVGDSMTIQWQVNPMPMTAAKKVVVFFAVVSKPLSGSCDTCWIQLDMKGGSASIPEPQVYNSDPRYDVNHIATCKWKITNPMSDAYPANPLSPVSTTCRIKVGDYNNSNYPEYSDVSDGTFTIQP